MLMHILVAMPLRATTTATGGLPMAAATLMTGGTTRVPTTTSTTLASIMTAAIGTTGRLGKPATSGSWTTWVLAAATSGRDQGATSEPPGTILA